MIIMTGSTVLGPDNNEYEVLDYLGAGNFGTVFKVKHRGTNDMFAMKTIPTPFTDDTALKAFVNEGNLAVGIRHPNVIEYLFFHDGITHTGLPPYILMEFADGGTLQDKLQDAQKQNKPFSADELTAMFRQLVAGMKAINEKLIHRDIKPDNILISKGILRISDFGLSKVVFEATRRSTFKGFGCVAYMAPEAWRFEKNTPQIDIYAMGVVFYQLATLRHPFDVKTPDPQKWMEAHLYQPVISPEKHNLTLGPKLAQIVMKMVEKDVSKRLDDWSKIEQLLEKSESAAPIGNSLVDSMLKRRLQQDTALQAAEAEARRKLDERNQFCKLALSQIEQTILPPIQELVEEFNRNYVGNKAAFSGQVSDKTTRHAVHFPSSNSICFNFRVCLEEDFIRETVRHDPFGRPVRKREVILPRIRNQRIMVWGVVNGNDGKGFNIALVQRPAQIYGELLMLINKMGFPSPASQRPEPFPFDFDEFEKEVQVIDIMHIYKTTVQPIDSTYISEFIAQYV